MDAAENLPAQLNDEGRYRLLLDAVTDYAIYMLDRNGVVTSWNSGARRFKGYEADEIIGSHFSTFYSVDDRQAGKPERALATAVLEGRFEGEGWRIRKDGTRFWAHVVIDPIRDPGGHVIGFAKVTRDLTERKLAEESLRRTEEEFRLLVQGVTDYAIYLIDLQGRVSNWNMGAQRIKGYLPEEIIGQHFSRFYTPEDLASGLPQRALETATREGRFESEGWRVRKDGTRFWANVVIDTVRDSMGTLIGFAKITRDVTERKQAQRSLDEAREALFQSQKMDAIGQLTGGIAHDFNNLLAAVLGSLELLRKRLPDDPKSQRLLDNAVQGAERGAALTKRMLAFARRQELNPEAVDVAALVAGMSDLLQRSIGPSVMVESRFPPALPPAQADYNQLELALLNLAVNARDAMPDGGQLVIKASAETIEAGHLNGLVPGDYIRLSVTDTGEGMDETTLQRAMEPFFTTKGVGKGTGLGLSMVHGLAEQSGGRLILSSTVCMGTTAELWLPAAQQATTTKPAEQPVVPIGDCKLTVLAVDDDILVLLNTTAMLEDLGHNVIEASSGRQALDILRRDSEIGLVITDQAMPHMTGSQLAEAIKAERPDLPIILATGYSELPSGADGRLPKLSKPFGPKALKSMIATVIGPT